MELRDEAVDEPSVEERAGEASAREPIAALLDGVPLRQVICLDADTILIVDRKSWPAYIDYEMQPICLDWNRATREVIR